MSTPKHTPTPPREYVDANDALRDYEARRLLLVELEARRTELRTYSRAAMFAAVRMAMHDLHLHGVPLSRWRSSNHACVTVASQHEINSGGCFHHQLFEICCIPDGEGLFWRIRMVTPVTCDSVEYSAPELSQAIEALLAGGHGVTRGIPDPKGEELASGLLAAHEQIEQAQDLARASLFAAAMHATRDVVTADTRMEYDGHTASTATSITLLVKGTSPAPLTVEYHSSEPTGAHWYVSLKRWGLRCGVLTTKGATLREAIAALVAQPDARLAFRTPRGAP
jgi:hypothetical protein